MNEFICVGDKVMHPLNSTDPGTVIRITETMAGTYVFVEVGIPGSYNHGVERFRPNQLTIVSKSQ